MCCISNDVIYDSTARTKEMNVAEKNSRGKDVAAESPRRISREESRKEDQNDGCAFLSTSINRGAYIDEHSRKYIAGDLYRRRRVIKSITVNEITSRSFN